MVPVLTPKPPPPLRPQMKSVAYRGPADLVAEIDAEAAVVGISRNFAMTQFLRAGLEACRQKARAEAAAARAAAPRRSRARPSR